MLKAAKKKWKNLWDTFSRELKKIGMPHSGADGECAAEYIGSWPYFDNMGFLKVVLKPRPTQSNINGQTELAFEPIYKYLKSNHTPSLNPIVQMNLQPTRPPEQATSTTPTSS